MIVYNDYNVYHYQYAAALVMCNHWTTLDVQQLYCTAGERHNTLQPNSRLPLLENVDKALLPPKKKTKKTNAHTRLALLENVNEATFATVVKVCWKCKPFA